MMKEQPKQEKHFGKKVWVNRTTDWLRRSECLCLNCEKLKPGQPGNCPIAQAFYEICKKENIALMVTRCLLWTLKK